MNSEAAFLNWFASQGIPMRERSATTLGGLRYYLFSAEVTGTSGMPIHAFGNSPDRKTAALKCAAEAIERNFLDAFFRSADRETSGVARIKLVPNQLESLSPAKEQASLPPRGMRTSNGWAVHLDQAAAESAASLEALERHLLIKSFYRWGWNGFHLIKEVENPDLLLYFLTTRLVCGEYVAGLVVAKSPLYPGVTLGYSAGKKDQIDETSFWKPAILEATSRIDSLGGRPIDVRNPSAWLQRNAKFYLESPFDLGCLSQGKDAPCEEESLRHCFLKTFDLRTLWELDFPLFATYCWGGDLIPLCDLAALGESGKAYFHDILAANHLSTDVPERHPIL